MARRGRHLAGEDGARGHEENLGLPLPGHPHLHPRVKIGAWPSLLGYISTILV
jgi:hypothetical protein